jgi:RNA polymerase sigma-70 factor (sigma-E family)
VITVEQPQAAVRTALVASTTDFDALFVRAHPSLVRTRTLICGDAEVASDCVADAFERAYVRWRRVSRLDDPAAWVRRVAINRARDVHRRRVRGRRAVERLASRPTPPPASPADRPDEEVLAALRELPLQQRTVVALHYLDDLPVADIAEAMRVSEGTVKRHLHDARARLRAAWPDRLDPEDAP